MVIAVRHLTKTRPNGALAAVLGSTAWVDLPRAVIAFAPDDEDDMIFHAAVVAGNRSGRGAAQGFRIELRDVGLKEPITYAAELGESGKSVDQLLATRLVPKGAKRASVKELILRELKRGPQALDRLKALAADEIDASGETVWRAANGLKAEGKVDRSNSGPGTPWLWYLAEPVSEVLDEVKEVPSDPIPDLQCDEVKTPKTAQQSQVALTSSYTSSDEVKEETKSTDSVTSSTLVCDEVRSKTRATNSDIDEALGVR
jgi:hypothetical protein